MLGNVTGKLKAWTAMMIAAGFLFPVAHANPGSVEVFANNANDYDYVLQPALPEGFGDGEFTMELWILPNDSFPVGPVGGGSNQRNNWSNVDNAPYSSAGWWFAGNFLLDGHQGSAAGYENGTFSLQFYGGGRVRWLFGDGTVAGPGGHWSIGAFPATNAPSLLDGQWHQITVVRRWSGASSASLELWVDGSLIDTVISPSRADLTQWWDNWVAFDQGEWYWGVEKQAAVGELAQYEDYKGLIDEVRFWSRAKSASEISSNFAVPVTGSETGLVGWFQFGEGSGSQVCDNLAPSDCMNIINPFPNVWSTNGAPLTGTGDALPPTVPGNIQGLAVSTSQIDLTWNPSSDNVGVTGYEIRRDGVLIATVAQTSYSDTGRSANTTYSYTVAARDAAGNVSAESVTINVTTQASADTQAPTTPTGLNGNSVSPSQIDLTWNASTDNVGVTGYEVRRDGALIATVTQTSYSDSGLTANTSYAYTLAARDAAGNVSAETSAINVMTQVSGDTQPPTTPTGLSGNAVSASQIDLSWNASGDNVGVNGYEVRRNGTLIATVAQTSYSDTGLTASTSYAYTVAARDAAGNVSPESTAVNVTTQASTDTQSPTTPGGLSGNAVSASQIDLTWNASSDNVGVTGYEVRRDGVLIATSAVTNYSDTGLSASTGYSYTVTARDAAGNVSAASAAANVTTQASADTQAPTAPDGLSGTAFSESQINLSWNASTDNVGVVEYDVLRDGIVVDSTSATSYADRGLSANRAYAYSIVAKDAAGNQSAASSVVQVTTLAGQQNASTGGGGGSIGYALLLMLILTGVLRRPKRRPAAVSANASSA